VLKKLKELKRFVKNVTVNVIVRMIYTYMKIKTYVIATTVNVGKYETEQEFLFKRINFQPNC